MRSGSRFAAVAAALFLLLTACSGTDGQPVASTDSSSTAAAAASASSAAPASPAAAPAAPVPGAYVGAGGPRPFDAAPLPTYTEGGVKSAVLLTPSGGIGCEFAASANQGGCGVRAYNNSKPYGCTNFAGTCKGNWFFPFAGDRVGAIKARTDTTAWMNRPDQVVRVDYGKVVYFDNWVCASAYNGLTCWNTATGSGVFLSNERSEKFSGPGASGPVQAPVQTSAAPTTPAPASATVVLGTRPPNGSGYGTAAPSNINNGGSRTGAVDNIVWSGWGTARATGTGTGFNSQGDMMRGAPATKSVQVVAYDLGDCNGVTAYRRIYVGPSFTESGSMDICAWS